MTIRVGPEPFDAGAELALLGQSGGGAVASFVGHVRIDDGVEALELECHPTMTLKALSDLAEEARGHWPLEGVTLIHRVGRLEAGEAIVLVAVASRHRAAAFDAARHIMERLKTDVPLWKKEHLADGTARWVEPGRHG